MCRSNLLCFSSTTAFRSIRTWNGLRAKPCGPNMLFKKSVASSSRCDDDTIGSVCEDNDLLDEAVATEIEDDVELAIEMEDSEEVENRATSDALIAGSNLLGVLEVSDETGRFRLLASTRCRSCASLSNEFIPDAEGSTLIADVLWPLASLTSAD